MNAKSIDCLLETVFFGGEGGTEDVPEPHPRFKWKPPGGEAHHGPLPPEDFLDWAEADIPPRGDLPKGPKTSEYYSYQTRTGQPTLPDDRTGTVPMSQMLPKGEVATHDDLLDFYNRIKGAKGKTKKAWKKEFDARRSEFESLLRKFVDSLLS